MPEPASPDGGSAPDHSPEERPVQSARPADVGLVQKLRALAGNRPFLIAQRVFTGVFNDGFIHAGNLAYMSILALFPFFIATAAIFAAIGEPSQRDASIDAFLATVPPSVAAAIGPVARSVIDAREGWLLWVGGLFGLWTASSLIETIRDILHRAYGVPPARAFWEYRLLSIGIIFASVLLLLVSLSAQVMIAAAQQVISSLIPQLSSLIDAIIISQFVSGFGLFVSLYLLFVTLTPRRYHGRKYVKWPGALFVASWWVLLTIAMPRILSNFVSYDLTYGNLAGVMIALFFFWLVGLGLVVGAELNAALAKAPAEPEPEALLKEGPTPANGAQDGNV